MARTKRPLVNKKISRRAVLRATAAIALLPRIVQAADPSRTPMVSLPVGFPDRIPGDGMFIRHGYACENTWYNPGWLHAGEDWYAIEGDTAGALVYAVAGGEVVFAGSDYPGRVIIVRHDENLYAMYGHLDDTLAVSLGDTVRRGQILGTVLHRTDGRAPSHLHFEIRTFFTKSEVNGDAPRYRYACGVNCPPGPGYWPMNAPEHPSEIGWRNPSHVLAHRVFDGPLPASAAVVVASGAAASTLLWSEPADHDDARPIGDLPLTGGDQYSLLAIATGRDDSRATSAEGYRLWYRILVSGVGRAWVQAARPSKHDTSSDGRPSSVRFDFLIYEHD